MHKVARKQTKRHFCKHLCVCSRRTRCQEKPRRACTQTHTHSLSHTHTHTHTYIHTYICMYIYTLGAGHRVSRPRGTGPVGDSVGEEHMNLQQPYTHQPTAALHISTYSSLVSPTHAHGQATAKAHGGGQASAATAQPDAMAGCIWAAYMLPSVGEGQEARVLAEGAGRHQAGRRWHREASCAGGSRTWRPRRCSKRGRARRWPG